MVNKFIQRLTTGASLLLLGAGIGVGTNYLVNTPQLFAFTRDGENSLLKEDKVYNDDSTVSALPNNDNLNFVSQVVREVGPGVVRINASRKVATNVPPMFNDPFSVSFLAIASLKFLMSKFKEVQDLVLLSVKMVKF